MNAIGAAGAVISGAVRLAAGDILPVPSTCRTVSAWPFACAVVSGRLKLPSLATTTEPSGWPPGPVTDSVAPASPVPLIVAPSPVIDTTGAVGGVVSGAVSGSAGEMLLAASSCTTVSASPLRCGWARLMM